LINESTDSSDSSDTDNLDSQPKQVRKYNFKVFTYLDEAENYFKYFFNAGFPEPVVRYQMFKTEANFGLVRFYAKYNVYKRSPNVSTITKLLIKLWKKSNLTFSMKKKDTITLEIYYDLVLINEEDTSEPQIRIFRGYVPNVNDSLLNKRNMDYFSNVDNSDSCTAITYHLTQAKEAANTIVQNINSGEWQAANYENTNWRILDLVNVIFSSTGLTGSKKRVQKILGEGRYGLI